MTNRLALYKILGYFNPILGQIWKTQLLGFFFFNPTIECIHI